MTQAWNVTRENSADLGFAWSCLLSGAVDLDEFREWCERVVETTPSKDLPAHMIELMMVTDRREATVGLKDLIGFWPNDPSLEDKSRSSALHGIAAVRGTYRPEDAGRTATASVDILARHPDLTQRFAAVFGFAPQASEAAL